MTSHTSLVVCTPRRTLVREWKAVLCPDHTTWACSGLGVEFLPLKLPGGVSLNVQRRQRGCMEEVTQTKGGSIWRRLSGEAKRVEPGGEVPVSCCGFSASFFHRMAPWCHWSVGRSLWV